MVLLVNNLEALAKAHSLPSGSKLPILINTPEEAYLEIMEAEYEAMEELLHKNILLIPIEFVPEIMEIEEGIQNLF